MEDNKILASDSNEDAKIESNEDAKRKELDETIARLDAAIEKMSDKLERLSTEKERSKVESDAMNKKLVATMVATFVLVFSLAVCSYAYFVSTTSSQGNVISTGKAMVNMVNETDPSYPTVPGDPDSYIIFPGYRVEKNVYIENAGAYPIYVRARLESSITLGERYAEHSGEIDLSLVDYSIDLNNWTEKDGYYYYNLPVNAGESTTNLLQSVNFSEQMGNIYKDSTINVKIRFEIVQSNNNGNTVFDAAGWSSAEEGGTP